MFRRALSLCLLVCLMVLACPVPTLAQSNYASDLGRYLSDHYKKKVFLLRNFYFNDKLRYDAIGAPIGQVQPGLWTVSGIIRIDRISVKDDRIEITAKRMVLAIDKDKKLDYAQTDRDASIVIESGPQNLTSDKADAILSRVFLVDQDHFEALVPMFWKPCITAAANEGEGNENCKFSKEFSALPGVHVNSGNSTVSVLDPSIERVGKGATPPKPIYKPDPQYSPVARAANLAGTAVLLVVVDKNGLPSKIWVQRPLGYGQDEMAVAAVATWKFTPAMRNGQPLAVQISVEVEFRLY
ncbi:MAG TPA: energy transducer TonB [Terriglobales bacterium]|nr:energy transducer TonB [Terriglobales bacterium]